MAERVQLLHDTKQNCGIVRILDQEVLMSRAALVRFGAHIDALVSTIDSNTKEARIAQLEDEIEQLKGDLEALRGEG